MNKCRMIFPPPPGLVRRVGRFSSVGLVCATLVTGGCRTAPRPGTPAQRRGDEIVVAGQWVHSGTRVVLWLDPGGYDAYRVERRFGPFAKSDWKSSAEEDKNLTSPNRYGLRKTGLTGEQIEKVRGGGWDLPLLQRVVDQLVIHFDAAGTSRQCFNILHDHRDLSVHFLLDLDGTVYQTLDLKERAWHATTSNSRSVGIEIANIGAYSQQERNPFDEWYKPEAGGLTTITIPERLGDAGERTPGFVGHPRRAEMVEGAIQGRELAQYDFTPQQYAALIKLTATLCKVFPNLPCKYPTDAAGRLIPHKLPEEDLKKYQGVLGHYHIQTDKVDPGPAFDWDYVINHARRLMNDGFTPAADETSRGHGRSRF